MSFTNRLSRQEANSNFFHFTLLIVPYTGTDLHCPGTTPDEPARVRLDDCFVQHGDNLATIAYYHRLVEEKYIPGILTSKPAHPRNREAPAFISTLYSTAFGFATYPTAL